MSAVWTWEGRPTEWILMRPREVRQNYFDGRLTCCRFGDLHAGHPLISHQQFSTQNECRDPAAEQFLGGLSDSDTNDVFSQPGKQYRHKITQLYVQSM